MDNGYAGADPTILKAITPSSHSTPYLDNLFNLVRHPLPSLGSNSPLPGLYEAASRIKREDMAGIFSRAATHLYENTSKHPEFSFSPQLTCDQSTCQALSTSSSVVPLLANTGMAASCRSTLNYQDCMLACLAHPVASAIQEPCKPDGSVSPARFSEFMLHAMEIAGASSSRLMSSNSGPPRTSTLDQNSSLTEGISSSPMYSKVSFLSAGEVPQATPSVSESPKSPSKQESSVMSAEDSDADRKLHSNNISKRRNCGLRKTQPKKVVCIPFNESKQKGEAPPSDAWAWRKYGQKPIKGSPFPRGYYRCSSSKGCPARKQVERSRSDPTMVMVTYTADHNHPWPVNRSSNASKAGSCKDKSQGDMEDTTSNQSKVENFFSSIINSPNAVDEQVVSSMDPLQEEESFFLQRDVDLCLCRTSTEGDDVFDNLGELPELSAIFSKGYGEGQFDEGNCEQLEVL